MVSCCVFRIDAIPVLFLTVSIYWSIGIGVRVFSAMEGEQRFETHGDKLMNYLRYWLASGESIKTSIRTRTRLEQIVKEGRFRGGMAPAGKTGKDQQKKPRGL